MKVCFISASWVREKEIIVELNKRVELLFLCPYKPNGNYSKEEVVEFCKSNNINLLLSDLSGHRVRNLGRVKRDYALVKRIKNFKPDIIYIEAFGTPYFAIFSRLLLGNRKTIISIMDYKLHQRSKGKFKFSEKFYRYIQLNWFKYYQFFSYSQGKLFKNDNPKKKSWIIRLFLVDKGLHTVATPKNSDKINIFYFGRIFYYKGVDILIEAINILAQKHNNFIVTIAGNCKEWEEKYQPLIKFPEAFNLQIRYIEKDELPNLFSEADYFIAPYREVTQSGPLLRAYNYDLIPIVSDEEGFTEYIEDGKTGFIFKNESIESCASVIERVLTLSEVEKEEITKNIVEFKKQEFDLDKITNKYINMFSEVIKNG